MKKKIATWFKESEQFPLLVVIASFLAAFILCPGCQTRLTAQKFAEVPLPIQEKVTVNGQEQLVTKSYVFASGGWYWTARSPLWATESLKGLDIGCEGTKVWLKTDSYNRDLSTNAVAMTKTIFDGSTNLVGAIGKAYATIATGGSGELAATVASKVYNYFKDKGGNEAASKILVDEAAQTLTVSDGTVGVVCDAAGNCSYVD